MYVGSRELKKFINLEKNINHYKKKERKISFCNYHSSFLFTIVPVSATVMTREASVWAHLFLRSGV